MSLGSWARQRQRAGRRPSSSDLLPIACPAPSRPMGVTCPGGDFLPQPPAPPLPASPGLLPVAPGSRLLASQPPLLPFLSLDLPGLPPGLLSPLLLRAAALLAEPVPCVAQLRQAACSHLPPTHRAHITRMLGLFWRGSGRARSSSSPFHKWGNLGQRWVGLAQGHTAFSGKSLTPLSQARLLLSLPGPGEEGVRTLGVPATHRAGPS